MNATLLVFCSNTVSYASYLVEHCQTITVWYEHKPGLAPNYWWCVVKIECVSMYHGAIRHIWLKYVILSMHIKLFG